ncbi:PAS domain-containing protein [Methylobacterium organophilum]|uniref:Blue-light-activated histidine kinase n=1 Tax=Methylobacterium organophilum TaxID=410 RepID=A0ABQ4T813_METOR|nr:PAS domain-containing protein [Methylobacterium organophilum]GJE27753.1 hypothetical protein LKMONMHP_2614 [Methylobacterium organophilum]
MNERATIEELQRRLSAAEAALRARPRTAAASRKNGSASLGNEAWLAVQKEAFQAAMNDAPLKASLGLLADAVVRQMGDGRRCAFYISDGKGGLHHVVGMSETYARQVDGFRISPESVACGLAAAKGAPVITPDVLEDPRWRPWIWLAREHGYRACWSFPVEAASGKLVGSFAMYFDEPREPAQSDFILADELTTSAAILISRHQEAAERVRAEMALRESEARFRAVAMASAQMLYRMSPDWRELRQLSGGDLLTNISEPIDNWAEIYLLPEDRPTIFAAIEDAIRAKSLFELELRVRKASGGIGWVLSRAVPLLDDAGEIREWFGVGSDVTERREAQEKVRLAAEAHRDELERQVQDRTAELRASRDLLQATMDCSMDMIQVFEAVRDGGGAIVDFRWLLNNHTSERLYGQVLGQRLLERNPGVVQEGIFDAFKRVTVTGEPSIAERHYVHEQFDGWYFQSAVRLGDGVATTTKDITAWKDAQAEVLRLRDEVAEAKLRESEARFRTLVEGVPQLVWRAVDGGEWTWSSPQWSAYTGLSEAESCGWGWLAALHADDRDAAMALWQSAEGSGRLEMNGRIRHAAEQRYRWFQSRATPVRDETGRIVEWLGTSTDVDDLRQMQERQQVLVAELQHRTRNLLGVVRSIAGQTMRASETLSAFEGAFNNRLNALSRVQGLLSRSEDEPITMGALIRSELDALGVSDQSHRVKASGPEVRLRKSTVQTLALALHELATNARKYGALVCEGGTLQVTWRTYADRTGRRLALEWQETGLDRRREERSPVTKQGGYGRELIERALPYALQARTTYELGETALLCTIDLPLPENAL